MSKLYNLKTLLELANKQITLQQLHLFAKSYQALYCQKHSLSTNYNILQSCVRELKKPLIELHQSFQHYQQKCYRHLIEQKQIATLSDFNIILDVCRYYPSITLKSIQKSLNKFVLYNNSNTIQQLIGLMQTISIIFKTSLLNIEQCSIMERYQVKLISKLKKCENLQMLCFYLPKIRLLNQNLYLKIVDVIDSLDGKEMNKSLFFSFFKFVSDLPSGYNDPRINQFILKNLNKRDFQIFEKINLLNLFKNMQSEDNTSFQYLIESKKAMYLNHLASIQTSQLNLSEKLKLFNYLKMQNQQKIKISLTKSLIQNLVDNFTNIKINYKSSMFQNQIQTELKKQKINYKKEFFLQTFFIDFLIQFNKNQVVLEVDGPSHFWKIRSQFKYSRSQNKRQSMWERKGYNFGSIPFYLWAECDTQLKKRVLIRSCIVNKNLQYIKQLIK